MDCYICNPQTEDINQCEQCRYELAPLVEWLAEYTGDNGWAGSNAPFISLHNDHVRLIVGFLAGGQMPFVTAKRGCNTQLIRTAEPFYSYVPFNLCP